MIKSFLILMGFVLITCGVLAADFGKDQLVVHTKAGRDIPFAVEVARTPDQLMQGMMFRQQAPENTGMLFVFPRAHLASFWMKNTLIPLDMLFIDSSGVIRHIHPNAKPLDETPITATSPSLAVFEIAGGEAARLGLQVGDKILSPYFNQQR